MSPRRDRRLWLSKAGVLGAMRCPLGGAPRGRMLECTNGWPEPQAAVFQVPKGWRLGSCGIGEGAGVPQSNCGPGLEGTCVWRCRAGGSLWVDTSLGGAGFPSNMLLLNSWVVSSRDRRPSRGREATPRQQRLWPCCSWGPEGDRTSSRRRAGTLVFLP